MSAPLFSPGRGFSTPPPRSSSPFSKRGISRAQQFQQSRLQQHTDRKQASTSIGRVIQRNKGDQPSTSIHHPGQGGSTAVTSVLRLKSDQIQGHDSASQEEMDNRRYEYMQRVIRARKAKAAKEAKQSGGIGKFDVGTGASLTIGGTSGLHKQLRKFLYKYRSEYKNVSDKDRKYFEEFLTRHAGKMTTGSRFGYNKKRKMFKEIYDDTRSGKISKEDAKDFKKIISNLK